MTPDAANRPPNLCDLRSLRYADSHAWNHVQDTIIDITASQFDDAINDVYVVKAPSPQSFHQHVELYGARVIDFIDDWYTPDNTSVGGGDARVWWQARAVIPPQARRRRSTSHAEVVRLVVAP